MYTFCNNAVESKSNNMLLVQRSLYWPMLSQKKKNQESNFSRIIAKVWKTILLIAQYILKIGYRI